MAGKTEEKTPEPLAEGTAPAPLTEEEIRAKRAALMEELATLPPEPSAIQGVPPGTIINKGTPGEMKVPWTWEHLRRLSETGKQDEFRIITFTPVFTAPVMWNGLSIQLVAGEEITTHAVFKGEYEKVRRARGINDAYFGPLRPDEKQAFAGFRSRAHRMDFGGLDPRPGGGAAPGTEAPKS